MGGVNLAEESQRILGSTDMIGAQIRSCKDEVLVPSWSLQTRIRAALNRHGLEDFAPDVPALLSHALHDRLKTLIEKLSLIAYHRLEGSTKVALFRLISAGNPCNIISLEVSRLIDRLTGMVL